MSERVVGGKLQVASDGVQDISLLVCDKCLVVQVDVETVEYCVECGLRMKPVMFHRSDVLVKAVEIIERLVDVALAPDDKLSISDIGLAVFMEQYFPVEDGDE